jgi:hypothetical protein
MKCAIHIAPAIDRSSRCGAQMTAVRGLKTAAIVLPVSGCGYSPTLDLLGSYFPAWMLCAVIGIFIAVVIRQVLALSGINEYVVVPFLTYTGFALSASLLVWLLWFRA